MPGILFFAALVMLIYNSIALCLVQNRIGQGGGTATQLPAEQYQTGSTPVLGFKLS
jgi:hypothetical protein